MDKLIKPGRIIFSLGIIGLAIICFISKDFIVGRPPVWSADFNFNPILSYISATLLILSAIAILVEKKAFAASLLIAVLILVLSVSRHLPHFMNDWLNGYKSMALSGGALIIASSFIKENISSSSSLKKSFIVTGIVLLAIFFIASGYAHFKFAEFVKFFIPAYIPFHGFWAYFCGICLFAGGAGLLIPATAKWAALLSGIMLAGWFVLLHIPRFIANTNDPSDRLGFFESFTFAGIFFVLAGVLSKRNNFHS